MGRGEGGDVLAAGQGRAVKGWWWRGAGGAAPAPTLGDDRPDTPGDDRSGQARHPG